MQEEGRLKRIRGLPHTFRVSEVCPFRDPNSTTDPPTQRYNESALLGYYSFMPQVAPSSLSIARKAFKSRRFEQAISLFEEIVRVQPTNYDVLAMLAQAYHAMNKLEASRGAFLKLALAKDLQYAELGRVGLQALDLQQGERGDAIDGFTRAVTVYLQEKKTSGATCPDCGNAIPPERAKEPWCDCGWGKREEPTLLYLAHIRALAQAKRATIEIKLRGDVYILTTKEVQVQLASGRTQTIDARIACRVAKGQPFLMRPDLEDLSGDGSKALFSLRMSNATLPSSPQYRTWDEFNALLWSQVGDPSVPPPDSLATTLIEFGGMSEQLVRAAEQVQSQDLTLGGALVNSTACSLQDLLASALGPTRVARPQHHEANEVGFILLRRGEISEEALIEAIRTQQADRRPLADILSATVDVTTMVSALEEVERLPDQGPLRDRIGEIMFEMGALSRTGLFKALEARKKDNRHLALIMVEMGLIKANTLQEGLSRQDLKRTFRADGAVQLGRVLIELGICTPEQIEEALVMQVRARKPLGELLVSSGGITPEQLITAIAEQETQLDALVARDLPSTLRQPRPGPQKPPGTGELPAAHVAGLEASAAFKKQTQSFKANAPGTKQVKADWRAFLALGLVALGIVAALLFWAGEKRPAAPSRPPPSSPAGR